VDSNEIVSEDDNVYIIGNFDSLCTDGVLKLEWMDRMVRDLGRGNLFT